jgi:hypothetical protein
MKGRTNHAEATRTGLARARARGKKLGSGRPEIGSAAGVAARVKLQDEFDAKIMVEIERLPNWMVKSYAVLAKELNSRRIPAFRGGKWTATGVRRVMNRAADARTEALT